MRREATAGTVAVVLVLGGIALAGWLISLATSFGRHVEIGFYELLAQVLVTLLLAVVVEEATSIARPMRELAKVGGWRFVRVTVRAIALLRGRFGIFVLGEVCALYAIATDESSTFLFVVPSLCALVATNVLYRRLRHRAGLIKSSLASSETLQRHQSELPSEPEQRG